MATRKTKSKKPAKRKPAAKAKARKPAKASKPKAKAKPKPKPKPKPKAKAKAKAKPKPKPAAEAKPKPAPKPKKLSAKARKELGAVREALGAERDDLLHQIAEIEARYSTDEPKDVSSGGDGEPESVTVDQERDLVLLENTRDLLDQVDRALAKVEDGTYGSCANCGKNIEAARIKALPHASLCISCKRLEERR